MVARTAYVALEVPGDTLAAANFNRLPGGWLGYVEVTANQTGVTTETDVTGLTVTVTVNSSRRIKISTYCSGVASTVSGDLQWLRIKESTTVLQIIKTVAPAVSVATVAYGAVVLTPSSGSHTYKVSVERNAGTGTVTFGAGATSPGWLLVEDIGPAS